MMLSAPFRTCMYILYVCLCIMLASMLPFVWLNCPLWWVQWVLRSPSFFLCSLQVVQSWWQLLPILCWVLCCHLCVGYWRSSFRQCHGNQGRATVPYWLRPLSRQLQEQVWCEEGVCAFCASWRFYPHHWEAHRIPSVSCSVHEWGRTVCICSWLLYWSTVVVYLM